MLYIVPVYLRLKTVLEELVNSGVLQLQTSHNMRNRSGHERRNYVLTQQGRLLLDKIEKLNELCPLDRLL
jgi:predicted transcriptional regulator